jgi:hypothetical protein
MTSLMTCYTRAKGNHMTDEYASPTDVTTRCGVTLEETGDGSLLRWGNSPDNTFEVVCKADDMEQVIAFKALLTASYAKALTTMLQKA